MVIGGSGLIGTKLTLEVSRRSGFYPAIFMGYPEPLRQLHRSSVVEPQARFFCRNRGVALFVPKGNPLRIRGLSDVLRAGTRLRRGESLLLKIGDLPAIADANRVVSPRV